MFVIISCNSFSYFIAIAYRQRKRKRLLIPLDYSADWSLLYVAIGLAMLTVLFGLAVWAVKFFLCRRLRRPSIRKKTTGYGSQPTKYSLLETAGERKGRNGEWLLLD